MGESASSQPRVNIKTQNQKCIKIFVLLLHFLLEFAKQFLTTILVFTIILFITKLFTILLFIIRLFTILLFIIKLFIIHLFIMPLLTIKLFIIHLFIIRMFIMNLFIQHLSKPMNLLKMWLILLSGTRIFQHWSRLYLILV